MTAVMEPPPTTAPEQVPVVAARTTRNPYMRLMRAFGRTRAFAWIGRHVFAPVDRWTYPHSGGAVASTQTVRLPTLLLTTTGRRTGRASSTPLIYVRDGGDLVVVGTNWGQRQHPGWSANLLANPEATVALGRRRLAVRARLLSEEDQRRLWPRFLEAWPGFETYAGLSGRESRMFALTPRREADEM